MDYKIKSKKIQSENTVEPVETLSKLIAWGGGYSLTARGKH